MFDAIEKQQWFREVKRPILLQTAITLFWIFATAIVVYSLNFLRFITPLEAYDWLCTSLTALTVCLAMFWVLYYVHLIRKGEKPEESPIGKHKFYAISVASFVLMISIVIWLNILTQLLHYLR